jgi:prophage regulatory protein
MRLIRLPDVMARTSLKRSQLYEMMSRGHFPKPVKLTPGGRNNCWPEAEIDEWIAARVAVSRAA